MAEKTGIKEVQLQRSLEQTIALVLTDISLAHHADLYTMGDMFFSNNTHPQKSLCLIEGKGDRNSESLYLTYTGDLIVSQNDYHYGISIGNVDNLSTPKAVQDIVEYYALLKDPGMQQLQAESYPYKTSDIMFTTTPEDLDALRQRNLAFVSQNYTELLSKLHNDLHQKLQSFETVTA